MTKINFHFNLVFIFCLILFFGACKNQGNGIYPPVDLHSDSIKNFFSGTIQYRSWKINSESVSPPVNGSSIYPIDKCNKDVTYIFTKFFSTSLSHEGEMSVNYHNTDCGGGKRNNMAIGSFYIDVNPGKLEFADDGNNSLQTRYRIIKSTVDSLVLQTNIGSSVITKIYLSAK